MLSVLELPFSFPENRLPPEVAVPCPTGSRRSFGCVYFCEIHKDFVINVFGGREHGLDMPQRN